MSPPPMFPPPGMAPAAPTIAVASPLNDLQLIALMLPGVIEVRERRGADNPHAWDEAIAESIELLGALVAMKVGLRIKAVSERVEGEIEAVRRAAGEAPEKSSIITDLKAPH